jgi:hypothetical protein
MVIAADWFTVTVILLVHPVLLVKVIIVLPAATPVTTPVLLTVATAGVPDTQGLDEAGEPVAARFVVYPLQTVVVPVITGTATTVITAVALHPALLVYVIVVVPADMPVTKPALLTVATPGALDCHALEAGVPEPVKEVADPTHRVSVPVIAAWAFTVIVLAAVRAEVAQAEAFTAWA